MEKEIRDVNNLLKEIGAWSAMATYTSPKGKVIPVFIREKEGLFDVADILANKESTQRKVYRDLSNPKNYVRRKVLPPLSRDKNLENRYKNLGKDLVGGNILILGAGDKIEYYHQLFPGNRVIASDVHAQFDPDAIIDGHDLPFKDGSIDLVIAGQVLEHTMRPWIVAKEIERVLKPGGLAQIEVPMGFHWHSMPYDFFRFTYSGLRSIFPKSELIHYEVPEGGGSMMAVTANAWLVNLSNNKWIRRFLMFLSRIMFWWLKYTDKLYPRNSVLEWLNPKGIAMTFKYDGKPRSDRELLHDFSKLRSI